MTLDIKGLRKIIAAATQPGPWSTHKADTDHVTVLDANEMWVAECGPAPHDAKLIAVSRVALPAALDELEKLRALLDTVRSRIANWNWAGLAKDADNRDFVDGGDFVDALRDVAAIEKALADHDKEQGK